ncbi:FACT complex subunit ssrp1 [Desmophyllum pertusum]|uniref:FACT complex subunit ssrp1 n=1 Tax=Desmophyllum pertusum TaxID=174260 RepID=A0A9W9Y6M7_9CNID|nr:FACT complex subunit ssrp1 [Desmophyllum pertusum]
MSADESFNPESGGEDQEFEGRQEKPQGKRKKKAPKDADAPKRPLSAYMLWLDRNQRGNQARTSGIVVTELSKVAGEKWRNIEDKTEWQEKAKEAKARYEVAMKAYKEKKANEPEPADASSPEAAKSSKKSSVKELFAKKADKKKGGSPRKSAGSEAQKFKSAEFVDTDDSSSEDEGKKAKPKSKPKGKGKADKTKSKDKKESDDESVEESEEEDADISAGSDSD